MRGARYLCCEVLYGRSLILGAKAGRNNRGGGVLRYLWESDREGYPHCPGRLQASLILGALAGSKWRGSVAEMPLPTLSTKSTRWVKVWLRNTFFSQRCRGKKRRTSSWAGNRHTYRVPKVGALWECRGHARGFSLWAQERFYLHSHHAHPRGLRWNPCPIPISSVAVFFSLLAVSVIRGSVGA